MPIKSPQISTFLNSRRVSWVASVFIVLALLAHEAWALAPGEATITDMKVVGDGCNPATVRAILAPDASSFTILYDAFEVRAANGNPAEDIKNCRVVLTIKKPEDLTLSVEAVDMRGFVALDAGVRGGQVVNVVSGIHRGRQGHDADFGFERWRGPVTQNYLITAISPSRRSGAHNCEKSDTTQLRVASRVRVQGAVVGKQGTITVDSADGEMAQKYRLSWQDCRRQGGGGGRGPGPGRGRGPGRGPGRNIPHFLNF